MKVNGYRIELAEIESVLEAHPLVDKAVVIVRENQLLAYVRTTSGRPLVGAEEAELRAFAGRSLTSYMMPRLVALE